MVCAAYLMSKRNNAKAQHREARDQQTAAEILELGAPGRNKMRYGHSEATRAKADDPCKA